MSMNEVMNGMTNPEGMTAAQAVAPFGMPVVPTPVVDQTAEPVTEQAVEEKPYTIRPLNARDIFPMTKIIRKIGLKDFGKCFEPEEINAIVETFSEENGTEKNVNDLAEIVGVSVVLKIVDM